MNAPMERCIFRLAAISFTALIIASCSRQSDSQSNRADKGAQAERDQRTDPGSGSLGEEAKEGEESEAQPSLDDIIDDCRGFVWLTKAVPRDGASPNCPGCAANKEAPQVFTFRSARAERVSCTGERCEVDVVIRASFNPSNGGTISGGLTGWISPEQREQYSRGETPPGEQIYQVAITYARDGYEWRPIEFATR
jgi:hypothetical protein